MNNKRINFFFIIFSVSFITFFTSAQEEHKWTSNISYSADIKTIVQVEDKIYTLTDGKLFIYNRSDESVEEYIKSNGGNTDITHITYNNKHKCLFIMRADANIELLYEDKIYTNILDLKEYSAQNIDKTINKVLMTEDFAYLATNFGYSIVNLDRKEIKESGIFNKKMYSILLSGDKAYAATEMGVLSIDLDDNMQDLNQWKQFPVSTLYTGSDYRCQENSIKDIVSFNEKLHFLVPDTVIYLMETPETVKAIHKGGQPQSMLIADNEHLIVTSRWTCWDYEDLSQQKSIGIENLNYIIPNGNKQGEYWLASSGNNLSYIKTNESSFEFLRQWIKPQGPASNYPFSQTYQNNQLIVTSGGFEDDRQNLPANLSILKDTERWTNIDTYTINTESGLNARDFVYAISNPSNPNHIFASSWGEGLYEFENNKFKKLYNKTNSSIDELTVEESDFRTTRVSGMAYDKNNNLWILNSMVRSAIKIYTKGGEWTELYYPELDKVVTNTKNILIDRYSNKWITSVGQDAYIFILNDNNTPTNISDDKYKFISGNDFVDQNNNPLTIHYVHSIAEDNDGNIWIGTDIGPFMIYNNAIITNREIKLYKIMTRDDANAGTSTSLLQNVPVSAILVDGANRKWIGTQTSGVYLLGTNNEELEHFTIDNSPLPSNSILSLSIDKSGNVYLGTARGLMSYGTGATKSADDLSDVYVYPNPVRPDYAGLITVTGLTSNSRIKITDIKGNLIIEGRSLGGQYSWNGLNGKGRRVDSGIYLVFGSSEDGSEGVVTKIMIMNE